MRIEDVDKTLGTYYLFWVEDYAVQVGQGIIPDRSAEHLGRVDDPLPIWWRPIAPTGERNSPRVGWRGTVFAAGITVGSTTGPDNASSSRERMRPLPKR